jgi:hypothetical protein
VIADPPLLAGAAKLTETPAFAGVTVPIVGAPGTVAGVTLLEAADAAPVPALLVAVTLNVYATLLLKPATVMGLEEPVPVSPPGLEVTV